MPQVSISIDVPNLTQATDFYCNALNCSKIRDQGSMTILSNGSVEIYLLERAEGSKPYANAKYLRTFDRHWAPIHLDFSVDDVNEAAKLVSKFGGLIEGSESDDWGSIAYCVDPFGHGFCLIKENS